MAISFATPSQDVSAAIGLLAVRHGQLDHILRMTIKSISGIGLRPSLDGTEGMMSRDLRERIRKMARRKLGEASDDFLRLEAFLTRAQRAASRRNDLLHGLWIVDLEDGRDLVSDRNHGWVPAPTVEALNGLSREMEELMQEMNEARLHGFLKDALNRATLNKV